MVSSRLRALRAVPMLTCAIQFPASGFTAVDRDLLEDADFDKTVSVVFNGLSATVVDSNNASVTVTQGANSSAVAITSSAQDMQYVLSGTTNGTTTTTM